MIDLEKIDLPISHITERLPGIFRNEIYVLDDIKYTEQYDDLDNKFLIGFIEMYGGVRVGLVGSDGNVSVDIPTSWVVNHKTMTMLQEDLQRLDTFLCAISKQYKSGDCHEVSSRGCSI